MQMGMARRKSHRDASQFGSSACVAVELGCGRRQRVLELANLRWSQILTSQDLCGLSPINLCASNALSGRDADQYAATLFLHDSDACHDVVAGY
jgi:hypothetical protein